MYLAESGPNLRRSGVGESLLKGQLLYLIPAPHVLGNPTAPGACLEENPEFRTEPQR